MPDEDRRIVTVAVVDDNPVIRLGLRALIETSARLRFLGEAADGDAAVELVRRVRPDVTLLDVRMPGQDGVQALTHVRELTRVIMLTYSDSPDVVRAAVEAGAAGYLVHGDIAPDELERAVLSVAEGAFLLAEPAATALRADWSAQAGARAPSMTPPLSGLSSREAEVMDHVARGLSNHDIARELYLSPKTVKNHLNRIFAKLGVTSRAEAMAAWWRAGTPGDPNPGLGP